MTTYGTDGMLRQQSQWSWVAGLVMLPLLLPALFKPLPSPYSALPPTADYASPGPQATPSALTKQFEETSYYLKDVDFVSVNVGWAVGEPHWDQARKEYTATIIKTIDGGVTWSAQSTDTAETLRNVDFVDANSGWAVGTNGAILHTGDGGEHWTRQTTGSTDEFRGVAFISATQGWATSFHGMHNDYSGTADDWRGSIWYTDDGGATWQAQSLPANASLLNRIKFIDTEHGWAVGVKYTGDDRYGYPQHAGMVYRTVDGGHTWEEFYSPGADITLTGVEWVDSDHGWVVGFPNRSDMNGGFVFHTADGGHSWQRQTPGGIMSPLWDVQFIDANRGYAVGFMYGAAWGPPVFRTADGGATWQEIRMAQQEDEGLFAVAVVDSQVVAVGDHDFVARSTRAWDGYAAPCNDGDCLFTQSYLNTHYTFQDVFFTDADNGWAAGSRSYSPDVWGQTIFHTVDGGQTWSAQYEKGPTGRHNLQLFSDGQHIICRCPDRLGHWRVGDI
ncbi:MAG: YCF48-related protein [Caldilineaceae bacterium]